MGRPETVFLPLRAVLWYNRHRKSGNSFVFRGFRLFLLLFCC
nr:MAG TPA: hypothetical protein [Caudoviricetes sp.]